MAGILGLFLIPLIAWLLSTDRSRMPWRTIYMGMGFQFLFALLILRTAPGRAFFGFANDAAVWLLSFTNAGSSFIFGDSQGQGFEEHLFAFTVLPTIIFFSSLISILYYFGILQYVVKVFAWLMMRLLRTSGAESLSASANIFVGQTEAPLLIRYYVPSMTRSELMAVMTGGMATVAGGVMAAYVGMGVSAGHLIAASVMSAPAALVFAKIMVPETEVSRTAGDVDMKVEVPYVNAIDAAAQGAADGLKLALNVGAMLLAFVALLALFDGIIGPIAGVFGYENVTLGVILGFLLQPLAWVMGVPWEDASTVGRLLGLKTMANEFLAYGEMQRLPEGAMSPKSQVITIYALCGFANLSSIAIQIGGIGGIAPERKADLARLGLRAMVAGTLACYQTATIAGLLFVG